ncbi:hypothetical protein CO100_01250, partial [Candidatus Berkelbacteria bacterium CG_4_9_14_3_um_filter_33_5]
MEHNPKSQIISLINNSKSILLVTHKQMDGDAIGSILALKEVLEKIDKKVEALVANDLPSNLTYLNDYTTLKNQVVIQKDFIINLDIGDLKIEKLGYKKSPDGKHLSIVITPNSGELKTSDISFSESGSKYNLVIILGSPDLESLGNIYNHYSQLFFETPTVQIDHHSFNENYAKINFVDITACSTCEMLVSLIEAIESSNSTKIFSKSIATALLTGIIGKTNSFQNLSTTPKSLTVAAQLVALGADKDKIILNLFKSKSVSTLKLWGRILNNLEEEDNFVWAKVSQTDLEETNSHPSQINAVIDNLLKTVSDFNFVVLISETTEQDMQVEIRSLTPNFDSLALASHFGGNGNNQGASFIYSIHSDFKEESQRVVK